MYSVSVIIPCFNVENYINRCLESLENQTIGFENLEIILIDDASTDSTLNIIREWEAKYENVCVLVNNTNMRQGGARNKGIRYAHSEWISFIDADDYVSDNMYETLLSISNKESCSLIHAKLCTDAEIDKLNASDGENSVFESVDINGWKRIPDVSDDIKYNMGIIPMIVKRDIVVNNNVFFPEGISYEDNFWVSLLQLYIDTYCFIDKYVYVYCFNEHSTTNTHNSIHHLERLKVEIELLNEYKKRGSFEVYRDYYLKEFIQRYYLNSWLVFFQVYDEIPDVSCEMLENIKLYFPDYLEFIYSNYPNYILCNKLLILPLLFPENLNRKNIYEIIKSLFFYYRSSTDIYENTTKYIMAVLNKIQENHSDKDVYFYEKLIYKMYVDGIEKTVFEQSLIKIIKSVGLDDCEIMKLIWVLLCTTNKNMYLDMIMDVIQKNPEYADEYSDRIEIYKKMITII